MSSPWAGDDAFGKRALAMCQPDRRDGSEQRVPGHGWGGAAAPHWGWQGHGPCPGSSPGLLAPVGVCFGPLIPSRCLSPVQDLLTQASVVTLAGAALRVPADFPKAAPQLWS